MKNIINKQILFADIHPSWQYFFDYQQQEGYFDELLTHINKAYQNNVCYPAWYDIFRLFKLINLTQVKVVIIGQDPYHKNSEQADGIAFSLKSNLVSLPVSLRNLFNELENDLHISHFTDGSLANWVKQGVFLMNTVWTVAKQTPQSHANLGWETFSLNLLRYLCKQQKPLFVLLGKKALQLYNQAELDDKNAIITAHPSFFSYKLFKNSFIFSRINTYLTLKELPIINWEL